MAGADANVECVSENQTVLENIEEPKAKFQFSKLHISWNQFRASVLSLNLSSKLSKSDMPCEQILNEPLAILNNLSLEIEGEYEVANQEATVPKDEADGDKFNLTTVLNNRRASRLRAMRAGIMYEKAKLMYADPQFADDQKLKESLVAIMRLIKDYVTLPEMVYLALRIINHIASLLIKEGEFAKVIRVLEQAEELDAENEGNGGIIEAYTVPELFRPDDELVPSDETICKLQRLVTNNLDMLSFSHQQLSNEPQHAYYSHQVLKRLLERKEGNVLIWASKASKLALFFASKGIFKEARHHLSAATKLLQEYESMLVKSTKDNHTTEKWGEIQEHRAELAKAWVRYGLVLFNVSKTRLVSMHYGEPSHVIDNVWVSSSGELYEMEHQTRKEESPFEGDPFEDCLSSKSKGPTNNEEKINKKSYEFNESYQFEKCHDGISLIKCVVSKINKSDEEDGKSVDEEKNEKLENHDPERLSLITKSDIDLEEHLSGYSSLGGEDEGVTEKSSESSSEDIELNFPSLDVVDIEGLVRSKFVETVEEAQDLYNFVNTWLKQYRQHYDIKTHPTEFVNAVLDKSELYRYLAFFAEELESQYNIQKQRSEALECLSAVLREMRPDCYIAAKVEILRELAEVQLELMALNLQRLHRAHSEAKKSQSQVNQEIKEASLANKSETEEKESKKKEHKTPKLIDVIVIEGPKMDGDLEPTRPLISSASKEKVIKLLNSNDCDKEYDGKGECPNQETKKTIEENEIQRDFPDGMSTEETIKT